MPTRLLKDLEEPLKGQFKDLYDPTNPVWEGLSTILEEWLREKVRASERDSYFKWPGHYEKRIHLKGECNMLRQILNILPTEKSKG